MYARVLIARSVGGVLFYAGAWLADCFASALFGGWLHHFCWQTEGAQNKRRCTPAHERFAFSGAKALWEIRKFCEANLD